MKKTYFLVFLVYFLPLILTAQSRIEKNGSPDFMLHNTTALNAGVTSRMLFKSGNYYTGGIATTGVGASNARLSFFTLASADQNSMLERMTILNNGFVGMNNNNPLYPLHMNASGIGFAQESATGEAKIGFYTSGSTAYLQTHNNVPIYFSTNNGGVQMALTTTGRLGIGTSIPSSKLEVKGKTTLVQGSDEAALEVNGGIKMYRRQSGSFCSLR